MNAVPMSGAVDVRVAEDREYARKVERAQQFLVGMWAERVEIAKEAA